MKSITALGELLIDFTPAGAAETGMLRFAQNPGGAPANVLAMATKLGAKTEFIGKVGSDDFGDFLRQSLTQIGIGCSGLVTSAEVNTTLAFVQLNDKGDRSFTFYRNPGADLMLTADEVALDKIDGCDIFHFGSVSLTGEPCRAATLAAVKTAKSLGKLISFDPNYRPFLWDSAECAKAQICAALPQADILKVSEEELVLITGTSDLQSGAKMLLGSGVSLVFISLGEKGAFFATEHCSGHVPSYDVAAVDTTGAGDAFLGAILHHLAGKTKPELTLLTQDELQAITSFACAAGSLTTTRKGAIPAMPSGQEIADCVAQAKHLK